MSNSLRLIDLTANIFSPNAEAAMSALVFALFIACSIRLFLVSSTLLSDNAKSTLFTLLEPAATAVSIHFDMLLMFSFQSVLN